MRAARKGGAAMRGAETRSPRRRLALALGILVLLAAAGLAAALLLPRKSVVVITLAQPFASQGEDAVLSSVLAEFQALYPGIRVVDSPSEPDALAGTRLASARLRADLVTEIGPGAPREFWLAPPTSWTGSTWVLAARRSAIAKLPGEAAAIASLREGSLNPADFAALLGRVRASGLSPLTLGNSHGWPFLLWLQHWAAATLGPEAATGLPRPDAPDDDPWLTRLAPAYAELASWKAKGWFDMSVWKEAWARGLVPLREGKALFALISPPLFSALDGATRAELEFFPFPGSRAAAGGASGTPAWTIGTVWSLGVAASSAHPREASTLLAYLTSPGVTAILSKRLGRPFFAWKTKPGDAPRVLPDWYGAANTPELERLTKLYGRP